MIDCPHCGYYALEHDDNIAGAGPFEEIVSRFYWCSGCGWSWLIDCMWENEA